MTVPDANAGRGPGTAPGAGKPAEGDSVKPAAGDPKPAEAGPGASEAKPAAEVRPAETKPGGDAKQAAAGTGQAAADEASAAADEAKAAAADAKQAAADASKLTADERAELKRLRAEVADLHDHPPGEPPSGRRTHLGWRAPLATVLIVVACLLAPLSVFAVWTANQVSSTDRYVENVAPLIHEPSVQAAITDDVTRQITTRLNVRGLTEQAASAL